VTSPTGTAILRARITDTVRRGDVFAPMHWTGETAPSARIDALIPAQTDPISGQPESKAAVVAVNRLDVAWYGFAVSDAPLRPDCAYWALSTTRTGYRAELAGTQVIDNWEAEACRLFGQEPAEISILEDRARGAARVALHENRRLRAALFVAPRPVAVMRDYLATTPGSEAARILTGRTPADAVGAALSAGTNCGACKPEIAALFDRVVMREAAE